jgi:hypothetical protein
MNIRILAGMLMLAVPTIVAAESEFPPQDARPLSEIVEAVESQGFSPIDLEFEDGRWEITALREGKPIRLYVDPRSGAITPRDRQ